MERYGEDAVEKFIDSCLSLENLIDIHSPFIKRREPINRYDFDADEDEDDAGSRKFQSKGYMDAYVNPPQVLKDEAQKRETEREQEGQAHRSPSSPSATSCCSCSNTPR